MMMKKKLTIIIPFANEGEEVENTVRSIRNHSKDDIDIIVINDASDDGYDYEHCLRKYSVEYVLNRERIGVAGTRDIGVGLCRTDYFLLLDAHMRFYDSEWVSAIVQRLDEDPRTILCAQTKVLKEIDGKIIERGQTEIFCGAYVNFYTPVDYLEPQWAYVSWLVDSVNSTDMQFIPCILGAGYAASKRYWLHLHGLQGLLHYGNDEVLISMKAWLEGGKCRLMPDVIIGHLYRQSSPYKHYTEKRIYNRLYISHLLCPAEYQKKLFAIEKVKYLQENFDAWRLFYENFDDIEQAKQAFERISTKKFTVFERLNRSRKVVEKESIEKKEKFLLKCLLYIVNSINKSGKIGLVNGKLGVTILLYCYARYTQNRYITTLADTFLDEIIGQASIDGSLNIPDGLLGIGWGVCYLSQQHFISCNVNEILSDLDQKIMEIAPGRMTNLDLEYGLGGILRYVLCRLYGTADSSERVFSPAFLCELYNRAKTVLEEGLCNTCPETYVEYILFYERKRDILPASIYDILMLPGWNKYSKACKDVSLHGLSGMCLEFVLMQMDSRT